jgi:protein-tyrosine phosphatase
LVSRHDKEAPGAGVLFVCTGNICRSPTAEGVFRKLARQAGLLDALRIDSAGTHDYHVGAAPDPRAQAAARRRGYDLSKLRARMIEREDFDRFDFILAMDQDHLRILNRLQPQDYAGHLGLMLEFAPQLALRDVPDPYYGGPDAFEEVLDLVESASQGLLAQLLARLQR